MWLSVICFSTAVLWPEQTWSDRIQSLAFGVLSLLISYGLFRGFLEAVASIGPNVIGRLAFWYIAAVLYFGVFGPLLALITLPFQWQQLFTDDVTVPLFVASIPSGICVSLAAAQVINKHYVEV